MAKYSEHTHPLNRASIFNLFNRIIGVDRRWRILCSDYIRARPGDRILDAGCGIATIINYLPDHVLYTGFDPNRSYIEHNQRQFAGRGTFYCAGVEDWPQNQPRSWDLFLAMGVLHHLDDAQALNLLRLAKSELKPGGRFVSADGCFTATQSAFARMVLRRDRGKFVRHSIEYEALAKQVFPKVHSVVRDGTLRIPHTLVVMECEA